MSLPFSRARARERERTRARKVNFETDAYLNFRKQSPNNFLTFLPFTVMLSE